MSTDGGIALRPVSGAFGSSSGVLIGRHPHLARYPCALPERVGARRADGSLLTLGDLPEHGLRWTRRRKQVVIECIETGLICSAAICRRYGLTPVELDEWRATVLSGTRTPVIWTERPRIRTSGTVRAGRLAVDLDRMVARVDDAPLDLSPSEWRILAALSEADGAVVSTLMIMGVLYSPLDEAAGPKIADVLICRLRKKLGPVHDRVAAIWGRGYYLAR